MTDTTYRNDPPFSGLAPLDEFLISKGAQVCSDTAEAWLDLMLPNRRGFQAIVQNWGRIGDSDWPRSDVFTVRHVALHDRPPLDPPWPFRETFHGSGAIRHLIEHLRTRLPLHGYRYLVADFENSPRPLLKESVAKHGFWEHGYRLVLDLGRTSRDLQADIRWHEARLKAHDLHAAMRRTAVPLTRLDWQPWTVPGYGTVSVNRPGMEPPDEVACMRGVEATDGYVWFDLASCENASIEILMAGRAPEVPEHALMVAEAPLEVRDDGLMYSDDMTDEGRHLQVPAGLYMVRYEVFPESWPNGRWEHRGVRLVLYPIAGMAPARVLKIEE